MKEIKQVAKGNNITQVAIKAERLQITLNEEQVKEMIASYVTNSDVIVKIVKDVIESIPPEQRVMPEKRVFVPTIQYLSYSIDDDVIRNTFKTLLRSSMNENSCQIVHPSFGVIISQLNSDEVKLLNSLSISSHIGYPVIDVRLKTSGSNDLGVSIIKNFSDVADNVCQNPNDVGVYLENLERLKLIEIVNNVYLTDDSHYEKLKNHPKVLGFMNRTKGVASVEYFFDKKLFRLTDFGVRFMQCCCL